MYCLAFQTYREFTQTRFCPSWKKHIFLDVSSQSSTEQKSLLLAFLCRSPNIPAFSNTDDRSFHPSMLTRATVLFFPARNKICSLANVSQRFPGFLAGFLIKETYLGMKKFKSLFDLRFCHKQARMNKVTVAKSQNNFHSQGSPFDE